MELFKVVCNLWDKTRIGELFFSMKVAPAAVCSWSHHRLFPLHLLLLQLYSGLHELSKAFGTAAALAALTGDPAFIFSIIKMTLKMAYDRFTALWSLSKVLAATWISTPWRAYSLSWDCKLPSILAAQDCTWALEGLADRVVIKCAVVLTWFSLLPAGKSNCIWTSLLYVSVQSALKDRKDGRMSKGCSSFLAFTGSVKSSAGSATSSAHAPQLFLCFLLEGRRSKCLSQVHSPTRVWASPGSRSVRTVTVRLISLKNSSPC